MTTQREWEQEVRDVFEKIKSHKERYPIDVNDVEVHVFPNVFFTYIFY